MAVAKICLQESDGTGNGKGHGQAFRGWGAALRARQFVSILIT
jgi:hypothetical protein